MDIEHVAEEITRHIGRWLHDRKNIVVGIDGYSGAGKTTLLKMLSEKNPSIRPIFMDDFVVTANTKEHLLPQIKNGDTLNLQWAPVDGLEKLRKIILDFKSDKGNNQALVVEGIFLFHPDVLDDMWDKRVYLDANKEEADSRRVKREKKRWGEGYFPESHPDSFARLFKIAHKRYEDLYHPKERADLIICSD